MYKFESRGMYKSVTEHCTCRKRKKSKNTFCEVMQLGIPGCEFRELWSLGRGH